MTAPIHPTATSVPLRPLFSALTEAKSALRGVAQRIDAWLEEQERAAADRDTLARMSDRELRDIGLGRAGATPVCDVARMRDHLY